MVDEDKSFIVTKNAVPFVLLRENPYITVDNQSIMVPGINTIIVFLQKTGILPKSDFDFEVILIDKDKDGLFFKKTIQGYFQNYQKDSYMFLTFSRKYGFNFKSKAFFQLKKDIIDNIKDETNVNSLVDARVNEIINPLRSDIFIPKEEMTRDKSLLENISINKSSDYYGVVKTLNSMIAQVFGIFYPQVLFKARGINFLFSNFVKVYANFSPSLTEEEIAKKIVDDLRELDKRMWFIYEKYFEIFNEVSSEYDYKRKSSLEEIKIEIISTILSLPKNLQSNLEEFKKILTKNAKKPKATALFNHANVEEAVDELT